MAPTPAKPARALAAAAAVAAAAAEDSESSEEDSDSEDEAPAGLPSQVSPERAIRGPLPVVPNAGKATV